MTITEMAGYFDLLQDKYGSPYHTESEKERFLNQAELDLINDFLPKDGSEINIEANANTWMLFNPLFFTLTTNMSGAGAITKSTLEASLASSLGFLTKIIRPLSVTWTDADGTRPVKGPTRFNNWATYLTNIFKVPTTKYPRYYEEGTRYMVLPINVGATITINGLRYPRAMSISGVLSSELPAIYHNDIVARALEFAGVSSRDQLLAELQKLNKV
jgi:hypothetical protein